jgi:restriction system protein
MAHQQSGPARPSGRFISHHPGWVALLFASLLYVLPRPVGDQAMGTALSIQDIGDALTAKVLPAFMAAAPYIPAALALIGLALLVARRLRRHALHLAVLQDATGTALREMPLKDFERLVRRGFRRQGYRVLKHKGGSPGGELDLDLTRDGDRYVVQCGHWREWQVGVDAVQELPDLVNERAADGAFMVTSGEFTHAAERFAQGTRIELVDIHRLREMVCGEGKPKYRLGPKAPKQPRARKWPLPAVAAAGVGALAIGGALWWSGLSSPLLSRPRVSVEVAPAGGEAVQEGDAYRSRTPLLPAELKMDFPNPGEVRSARVSPRVVEPTTDAEREQRAEALKADFEFEYKPPADCDNWQSMEHMVACGNHRIRAWKEYQAKHGVLGRIDTAHAQVVPPVE